MPVHGLLILPTPNNFRNYDPHTKRPKHKPPPLTLLSCPAIAQMLSFNHLKARFVVLSTAVAGEPFLAERTTYDIYERSGKGLPFNVGSAVRGSFE